MTLYYLDIETTGLEPGPAKIITIQYAVMDEGTGGPAGGSLHILREWDCGSEKRLLERFTSEVPITSGDVWDFVPIGYNLRFEDSFLRAKSRKHGMREISVLGRNRPYIDLHQAAILINGGRFKGSGMDDITDKPHDGSQVPLWYNAGRYDKIEEYVRREFDSFANLSSALYRLMPALKAKLRQ